MRADRLIAELILLQQRGQMTARELAEEVEVTERTVYRDIDALSFSGVPIYAERGPGGGISLLESYRTTLTGLKRDEVRALFMLSIPTALDEVGLDADARMAFLKLSAALPSALQDEEQRVRQRFYIDPSGWQSTLGSGSQLAIIQKAVWEDRFIKVRYQSLLGERIAPLNVVVEPYGLVAWRGEWHLVSRREGFMWVLKLDRILEARILPEHFSRDAAFKLAIFWKDRLAKEDANPRPYLVQALSTPEILPYLGEYLDESISEPTTYFEAGIRRVVRLSFKDLKQARSRLLGFGSAVEVLAPLALRLSIADYGRQIAALYA